MAGSEAFLVILDAQQQIREINLNSFNSGEVTFGRGSMNDIVISSSIASKQHGTFRFINGQWFVEDNNSTNGIMINKQLFRGMDKKRCPLKNSDIIRIDSSDLNHAHSMGVLMLFTTVKSSGRWGKYNLTASSSVLIGRSADCGICVDNLNISRHHAEIINNGNQFILNDLDSLNGIFVNGIKVTRGYILHEKDIISIVNSIYIYTSGMLIYKSDNGGTRVVMQNITRTVKSGGRTKEILHDVNLVVEPNEFIAVIGGSGAGKSTVMNAMSGFEQANYGRVFVNDIDLYQNYQSIKGIMGYVPQQDIIYENLTLFKMLEYTAMLRLDKDISKQERNRRVYAVLDMVELRDHAQDYIRSLSGGQKKRASIALELLADPGLFFLDEPTSGLDPGTEESLMKTLSTLSENNGKTIVMVTHTTQNLHLCDKILFMGRGGKICFYGSPSECMKFFGVNNLTEIYNKASTERNVEYWSQRYIDTYGTPTASKSNTQKKPEKKVRKSFCRQFLILSMRYMTLIKNDIQRLMMIFAQPIIIAILLAMVASDNVFEIYNSTKSILFALSCAGIWLGLFNSIQEICKERNILKREYMADMRLGAYVMSKFTVQLLLSIMQALIITIVFSITVGMPSEGILFENPFAEVFISMVLTIFSSSAIGLIVSSVSKNSDKAMTAAPFLLIIQLLFSGILFDLTGIKDKISYFTVSRWSLQALGSVSNLNALDSAVAAIPRDAEEIYEFTAGNIEHAWLILAIFIAVCFAASILVLKNVAKDSR